MNNEQHLNRRIVFVWAFPALAIVVLLAFVGALYYFLTPEETLFFGMPGRLVVVGAVLLISLLLILIFGAWAFVSYSLFTFQLADNEIIIRFGVLTRHRVVIPYERIQNINYIRSPVERLFGLVSLNFETAGAELRVTEGVLPGLAYKRAIELIEAIMANKSNLTAGARRTVEQPKSEPSNATLAAIFEELRLIRGLLERREGGTRFGTRAAQPPSASLEDFAEPSHDQLHREVEKQIEELKKRKKK